ncbi:MAG: response regulator [Candidatus Eisenbacteria bacterium]|uniref:Response regulator n=1 Tax=Eiseniibacteriota bacterium TaxID=2212470 RepID=A0A937X9Z5_UNCEI|nr:response regulator [Candidatus Eisenbacteria bacterium]
MEAKGKRAYILLAEDEPTNQYVFRAILESGDYEVQIVDNGRAALEEQERRRPDIILLDMMMPIMDGYETARRMVLDARLDGIPILALTAKAMKGDAEKTLEAGCDDYMSKPIRRQELLGTVQRWLDRPIDEWMPRRMQLRGDSIAQTG